MKNNKGFTLVEMLVSFTLAMIIIIIMFQLIINLKDLYITSGKRTELLNKQYLMTYKIYSDFNDLVVVKTDSCLDTNKCISFTFSTGETKKLIVDETNKTITYDDYIIKLNSNTNFGTIQITTSEINTNTKILSANIPIYNNSLGDTNFGINIVCPYTPHI